MATGTDPYPDPDPPVDMRVDHFERPKRKRQVHAPLPKVRTPRVRAGVSRRTVEGCWADYGRTMHIRTVGVHAPYCRTNFHTAGVGVYLDIEKIGCRRCLVELQKRGGLKGVVRSLEAIGARLAQLAQLEVQVAP